MWYSISDFIHNQFILSGGPIPSPEATARKMSKYLTETDKGIDAAKKELLETHAVTNEDLVALEETVADSLKNIPKGVAVNTDDVESTKLRENLMRESLRATSNFQMPVEVLTAVDRFIIERGISKESIPAIKELATTMANSRLQFRDYLS